MDMLIIGIFLPALIIAYPFMWIIEKIIDFVDYIIGIIKERRRI
jgi:hypothetical protein